MHLTYTPPKNAKAVVVEVKFEKDNDSTKQDFANTMSDLNENLSSSECERYGMTWGCDGDCPVLRRGECSVIEENTDIIISEFAPVQIREQFFIEELCVDEHPHGYCFKEDYEADEWETISKSMCEEWNARLKGKATNIEVKRIEELCINDLLDIGIDSYVPDEYSYDWCPDVHGRIKLYEEMNKYDEELRDNFIDMFGNEAFGLNPYIFLIHFEEMK